MILNCPRPSDHPALLLGMCGLLASAAWSQNPGVPSGTVSVKSAPYSAMGDGLTNDYSAFQRALNSGQSIFVPGGRYLLNNSGGPLLTSNFSRSLIFDPNAIVLCTTPDQGCLAFVGGSNPSFSGIHISYTTVPTDDCRIPNGMCSTLYFQGMTNASIDSTTIDNGWAIAFGYLDNIGGQITHTTVNHSTRDGVFLQDNQNMQISDLNVTDSGDDCLGFHDTTEGGGRHGAMGARIHCTSIRGGGMVVAGASNVTVSDFVINGTSGPGIYAISDPTQGFLKPTNVVISNGVIRNVGSVADTVSRVGTQHGIMMYGSAANPLGTFVFQGIQIAGTNGSGVLGGGFVDSVALNNLDILNSGLDGPVSNASCVSITQQETVIVNGLSVNNCYRTGFLSVQNYSLIVSGLTVTNAWLKGAAEPGAKAVDLFANYSVQVDATVMIDRQQFPTGYVFSERLNTVGRITNLTAQIEYGTAQYLNGSGSVAMTVPAH